MSWGKKPKQIDRIHLKDRIKIIGFLPLREEKERGRREGRDNSKRFCSIGSTVWDDVSQENSLVLERP